MIEAIEAIQQQYGVKEGLSLKGNEITEWPYDEPKPTQKELDALAAKYQADTDYMRKRKAEMPADSDILDAIYTSLADGDNSKLMALKAAIDNIKLKYPKPKEG